jgi:hypothetical protein
MILAFLLTSDVKPYHTEICFRHTFLRWRMVVTIFFLAMGNYTKKSWFQEGLRWREGEQVPRSGE